MKMIGNQGPCITEGPPILKNLSKSFPKVIPFGVATEYRLPFNAPDHNVVHQLPLPLPRPLRKPKILTVSPFPQGAAG
jgi:hypothetical protein